MKKAYSKPEIMFEDFSLSVNVAVGCEIRNSNPSEGVCGWESRNGMIFVEGVTGCKYKQPDGYDSICYHNPSNDNDLFNS